LASCEGETAAAVAVALAVGQQVADTRPLERDLIVALFDAEEPPYFQSSEMGSNRFWKDQRDGRAIHAAVIMDLVGHDVAFDGLGEALPRSAASVMAPLLFVTGVEGHSGLRSVLESAGAVEHLPLVPTLNRYVGDMSDHGVFRENGVPFLFLSCGRWPHYHMPSDTPDRLNYEKMARITRQVLGFAAALDTVELPQVGHEQFSETLDLEISRMRLAFGPSWDPILNGCGLDAVSTRGQMDRLVAALLGLGVA
jgi:hypothetical protein